jgi:enamine deaminase RidA (YjgF/YER057c/UK114 family)
MGPHVHDPRSGEIISAHIIFWHDVVKLAQSWYFVQCSACDPRAQKLPLPDDLTGELLRYICAHEVGHTLGLRHNHRASGAYTIEQLRDPKFTAKHGSVGSIMSYGRFNYVCQPEDKVKQLIPVIAPYDFFAIEWGYKAIPGATTSDAERATLDKWASRQLEEPMIRFGGEDGPAAVDPTVKTENIGADSIKATELGLKNLDRVLDHLVKATTNVGEDFSLLEDTYKTVITHRRNWFNAVALNVGGVVENRTLGGRGTETFSRVPREKQKAAVKFLNDNAFTTPAKLLNPAIVNRFKYTGLANDVGGSQKALMQSLLSGSRIRRLMDEELLQNGSAYTVTELVNDVQDGIFSELTATTPKIDVLRRNLQRAYLDHLKAELMPAKESGSGPIFTGGSDSGSSDFRAVARLSLQRLRAQIAPAMSHTKDVITIAHLQDCDREIETMLTGKK